MHFISICIVCSINVKIFAFPKNKKKYNHKFSIPLKGPFKTRVIQTFYTKNRKMRHKVYIHEIVPGEGVSDIRGYPSYYLESPQKLFLLGRIRNTRDARVLSLTSAERRVIENRRPSNLA